MSTTGVLVSGARRRCSTAASPSASRASRGSRRATGTCSTWCSRCRSGVAYVTILARRAVGRRRARGDPGRARAAARHAVRRPRDGRAGAHARPPPAARSRSTRRSRAGSTSPGASACQLWLRDPVTWKSLVYLLAQAADGHRRLRGARAARGSPRLVLASPRCSCVHAGDLLRLGDRQPARGAAAGARSGSLLGLVACTCSTASRGCTACARGSCSARAASSCASASRACATPARASSPPPTTSAAGSSATSTTAPSSAWSRSTSCSAWSRSKLETDPAGAAPLVARAREEATEAVKELRELARGIHPALLADRGLTAALEALAARAPFEVAVDGVPEQRLPAAVEATAYFITAEALTNVAKYAGANGAACRAREDRAGCA